jgi:type VI secretion system Hcp family effector
MRCTSLRLLRNLAAAISIGFVAAPTAALADLITLAIPGITGDVRVAGQEKTIEVLSLSNNVFVPVSGGGSGQPTGRPQFSPMIIHKRIDIASPQLFVALLSNKRFPNAVITFLKSTGESLTKFFTITLTDVFISNFRTDAAETDVMAGPEQVNLNYSRIQLRDEVTGTVACFDFTTNSSC